MRSGAKVGSVASLSMQSIEMIRNIISSPKMIVLNDSDLKTCLSAFHAHVLSLGHQSSNFRARLEVPTGDICDTREDYSGPSLCAAMLRRDATCFVAGRVTFTPNIPPLETKGPRWIFPRRNRPLSHEMGEWTRYFMQSQPR
jgi:hypothetical protein